MHKNEGEWVRVYQEKNALWFHDGNLKRPHACLRSGNHSNGFFNSRLVIPDDVLLQEAASDLVELMIREGGHLASIQGVVGPQTGATKLAEFIRRRVTATTGYDCFSASPSKEESGGKKTMVFNGDELARLSGKSVVLCEDVLTTGGSVELAARAAARAGARVLPFLLVLVNRSGLAEVNGKVVVALIDRFTPIWVPAECPLCKSGSKAIRPKGTEEWRALNAPY